MNAINNSGKICLAFIPRQCLEGDGIRLLTYLCQILTIENHNEQESHENHNPSNNSASAQFTISFHSIDAALTAEPSFSEGFAPHPAVCYHRRNFQRLGGAWLLTASFEVPVERYRYSHAEEYTDQCRDQCYDCRRY